MLELHIKQPAAAPGPAGSPPFRWAWKIFLAAGIALLGYYGFAVLDGAIFQIRQNRQFDRALAAKAPARDTGIASAPAAVAPLAGPTATPAGPPPVAEAALGRIEIDSIGLRAMIAEGVDNRTLRRAVGHVPGTPWPGQTGNVALAGHRDTFFRSLRKLQKGDAITLTTADGPYRYVVDFVAVVGPGDTALLDNSPEALLTLVTCYPFYYVGPAPKRFIVRAHMGAR